MLAVWLGLKPSVLWCHVPNGGLRQWSVARQMKAAGCKAGVPDVLIFTPPPQCQNPEWCLPHLTCCGCNYPVPIGVAIELKASRVTGRAKGRASPEQVAWLEELTKVGWMTRVCYGASEAITFLVSLGY